MAEVQGTKTSEITASARLEDCPAPLRLAINEAIQRTRGTTKGRRNLQLELAAIRIAAAHLEMNPTQAETHEAVGRILAEGNPGQITEFIHAKLVETGAYKPKKQRSVPPASAEPQAPVAPPAPLEPTAPDEPQAPTAPPAPIESEYDPLNAIIQFRATIASRYSGSRTISPAEIDSIIVDALTNEPPPPVTAEKPEDTVARLFQLLAQRLRSKASMLQTIAEDLAPEDQPDLSDIPPIKACTLEDLQRLETELETPRTKNSPKRTRAILETLSICYFGGGGRSKKPLRNASKARTYTTLLLEFQAKHPDQNPEDLVISVQRLRSTGDSLQNYAITQQSGTLVPNPRTSSESLPSAQASAQPAPQATSDTQTSQPAQAQEKYKFDPDKPIESYTTRTEAHLACMAVAATGDFQKGLELAKSLSCRFPEYRILINHILGFEVVIEILGNPSIISKLRIREAHVASFILEYAEMTDLAIQCLQQVIRLNSHAERVYANTIRLKNLQTRLAKSQNQDTQHHAPQPPETSDSPSATPAQLPTATADQMATPTQPPTTPADQSPPPSPSPEKKPDTCRELLTWLQRLETTSRKWTKENGFLIIPDTQQTAGLSGELEKILADGNTEQLYTDHLSTTGTDNLRGMIGTSLVQGIRERKVKTRLFDQVIAALESLLPST